MTVILVFLGGTIGAPARYLLDRAVQRRHESVFPWGTLTVNLIGCLVLGVLTGASQSLPKDLVVFAGTGFCGALTTFSTFGFETTRLLEEGSLLEAGLNALGSLVLGVLAAALGYAAGVGL
ncbi:fluoride efflux transporter CrcB [Actinoallomurus bryophytorum]|uniref:Fluoride-specific ion channel FluC n=1 Tax=Actinoallomurus bryophytorum TaxID=1490222 RepID=A0A543CP63_9ACTN|nr:fluoride efflux transporter CrcB [Actinoallomurus bryophytorum]TQL98892.1 camphor resistance protein CrcB [Actinoallomurus bryophytorum]